MSSPPAPAPDGNTSLWFGVLSGPVAWFVHFVIAYGLAAWVCGPVSLTTLHLVTVIALLVTMAGGGIAWHRWREVGYGWPAETDEGTVARVRLLGALSLLSCGLYVLLIVGQWIAVLMVDPCAI